MGRILVGISAWADVGLLASGSFYPDGMKAAGDLLEFYSSRFGITEIDSSFYKLPGKEMSQLWITRTPPGFVFDAKAFRLLTRHPTPSNAVPRALRAGVAQPPDDGNVYINKLPERAVSGAFRLFAESLRPLHAAGKLGVVLFQFPPWFHPSEENREYIAICAEKLPDYRVAVEFRSPGWLRDDTAAATLALLSNLKVALVCVDEPQGLRSSVPPVAEVTARIGVVRFHGRNRENWEKPEPSADRFNYLYSEEELAEWVPKIKKMAEKAEAVHVILKNKHRDYPATNALQMVRLLGLNPAPVAVADRRTYNGKRL